jgi:hypothetical protein
MRTLFLAGLACLSIGAWSKSIGATQDSVPQYEVTEMRAHMILNQQGSLSENIIGESNPEKLRNLAISSGSGLGPADALLVLVRVNSSTDSFEQRRKVELVVRTNGKVVSRRGVVIGLIGKRDKFISFLISQIGCSPLTLEAAISGGAKSGVLTRTIPFSCAE